MCVLRHPIQHPSVDIRWISRDVQSCIELKNDVVVPITDISAKWQQSGFMKNVEDWGESGNFLKLNMRNMHVLKYFVSSTEHRCIIVELSPCPKLHVHDPRLFIRIVSDEIHAFFIERFLLKLWPL